MNRSFLVKMVLEIIQDADTLATGLYQLLQSKGGIKAANKESGRLFFPVLKSYMGGGGGCWSENGRR